MALLSMALQELKVPAISFTGSQSGIITDESQQNQIGKFDRKFTILDRYVLDMTAYPARTIDRRVAVAIGVMLDTGERR